MKFANKTDETRVIINYQRRLLGLGNGLGLGLGPSKGKSSALVLLQLLEALKTHEYPGMQKRQQTEQK